MCRGFRTMKWLFKTAERCIVLSCFFIAVNTKLERASVLHFTHDFLV